MQVNETCAPDSSPSLIWMLALLHSVQEANLGKEETPAVMEQAVGEL